MNLPSRTKLPVGIDGGWPTPQKGIATATCLTLPRQQAIRFTFCSDPSIRHHHTCGEGAGTGSPLRGPSLSLVAECERRQSRSGRLLSGGQSVGLPVKPDGLVSERATKPSSPSTAGTGGEDAVWCSPIRFYLSVSDINPSLHGPFSLLSIYPIPPSPGKISGWEKGKQGGAGELIGRRGSASRADWHRSATLTPRPLFLRNNCQWPMVPHILG